jgi:hypothetical protein
LLASVASVALIAAAGAVQGGLLAHRAAHERDDELLFLPRNEALPALSLGYREALADLIWVRALIFAGRQIGRGDLSFVGRYTWAITTLAPRFEHAYAWGGVTAIYAVGDRIQRSDVDAAIAAYDRGLAQFPESHKLLFQLAMVLLHEVPNVGSYSEAEIASARRRGVELVRKAAAFGADTLVRQYAVTLTEREGGEEALLVQFLEQQLLDTDNDELRRLLQRKLDALTSRETREALESIQREFEARRRELAPYLDPATFAVLEPPRSPWAMLAVQPGQAPAGALP